MQNIQKGNPTIKDFKIIKATPDGYQIFASLDQTEVGTMDTQNVFLYRLATADPSHSFTQEYATDTRFYQTVRALTDSSGNMVGIIYTTQSLSEADKSINDNIRNSIIIFAFAIAVVIVTWLVLNKTRLGLFVRAVTQNRTMAACVGVKTVRVDMYAFAFGAGIAGLGGVALSQIGNVGPDLGQSYIVDSFMVNSIFVFSINGLG